MSDLNEHGLSRYIKEDVKLKIRQNSKFGCVVPHCRNAFYTYEHLIPEFKDAKEHDPERVCLACPNHNPRRTGPNGQENYSKEQLIEFYNMIKNQNHVPSIRNDDFFHGFKKGLEVKIGQSTFKNTKSIININGLNVLSFVENLKSSLFEPQILFSGLFNRHNGERLFEIKNNEWLSDTNHWDVETLNGRIKIRNEKELIFEAHKIPDKNRIEILKLSLWYDPFHVEIKDGSLFVGRVSKEQNKFLYLNINGKFEHSKCAIFLTDKNIHESLNFYGFELSGDSGASLKENGIYLGKGGGIMRISSIQLLPSANIEDKANNNNSKTPIPNNGNYFVKGKVEEKVIEFPLWTESEYWLNGQKLNSKPNSWGTINAFGDQLYYLSKGEKEDLVKNKGFIGHFADDLLNTEIQDKVFEIEIEENDTNGNSIRKRVKRCDVRGRKVISEINPSTGKFYHPQQFAGISPWKKE